MSREPLGHTLQATALINEAQVRLIASGGIKNWQSRAQFFGVCARLMRQILTDFARSRLIKKREINVQRVSLDESLEVSAEPRADLVVQDDALNSLAAIDLRKSQVVEGAITGRHYFSNVPSCPGCSSGLLIAWCFRCTRRGPLFILLGGTADCQGHREEHRATAHLLRKFVATVFQN